jgi:hypothetical protein
MKILMIFIVSFSLCAPVTGVTAEIDSVTPRHVVLDDVLEDINAIINTRISEGVEKANAGRLMVEDVDGIELVTRHDDCDVEDLYTELRKSLFQSLTASWGLKGYDLDLQLRELLSGKSYSLSLSDSIYRDISYLEGLSLNLKELSDVANIDGQLVGLDKLGHFFSEGWQYFEISRQADSSLEDALDWGSGKEAGLYGYTTTGVFSYADLVANFHGWRFWNRVLLKRRDPLSGVIDRLFDRPYVTCNIQIIDSFRQFRLVRAWQLNRQFDLGDYVDAMWDEGNNCNSYADAVIEEKVTNRIADADPGYVCPVDAKACVMASERYGIYASRLLHPACQDEP